MTLLLGGAEKPKQQELPLLVGEITDGLFWERVEDEIYKAREEMLLKEAKPMVLADLGYGVLDAAMVETAAYCLSKEVA